MRQNQPRWRKIEEYKEDGEYEENIRKSQRKIAKGSEMLNTKKWR